MDAAKEGSAYGDVVKDEKIYQSSGYEEGCKEETVIKVELSSSSLFFRFLGIFCIMDLVRFN